MKVIIKQCSSEHFEGWVQLRQCLWPDDTLDEHRRSAESILNRPSDAVVYLACEDREVIAFAEGTLRRDYVNGCSSSPVGFLEGLYVRPPFRRCGLARLLCKALEGWAKEKGCREFASDVFLHNEVGQRRDEGLGLSETDRVVYYKKQL